jgi:pyruvate-ferredoxin/flavodoxin oxidoreductase
MKLVEAKGKDFEGLKFRIQVSVLDCTGCGNCAQVCPAKDKALEMKHLETQMSETENWEYMSKNVTYKDNLMSKASVKGSQFASHYLSFQEPVQDVARHHT